jgi:hypothetical protein
VSAEKNSNKMRLEVISICQKTMQWQKRKAVLCRYLFFTHGEMNSTKKRIKNDNEINQGRQADDE